MATNDFVDLLGEPLNNGDTIAFYAPYKKKPAMWVGVVLGVFKEDGEPVVRVEPHSCSRPIEILDHPMHIKFLNRVVKLDA